MNNMEIWDLYDKDFKLTGKTMVRSDVVPEGYYHLSAEIWIINSKKQVLLVRNSLNYQRMFPGYWACVGGCVNSNEDKGAFLKRMLNSRIGHTPNLENITELDTFRRDTYGYFCTIFILKEEIDLNRLLYIDGLVMDTKWVGYDELSEMIINGEIPWYLVSRIESNVYPLIK